MACKLDQVTDITDIAIKTPSSTHLNQIEVDMPIVPSSGGDEPVPVLVLLWRVYWSDLLPSHSWLESKISKFDRI